MKVLVFESNLLWSERLRRGLHASGHVPIVIRTPVREVPPGDLAIVNLGSDPEELARIVAQCRERGIRIVAHAGHKEGEVLERGRALGCDLVVSNSTLTHRLRETLERLASGDEPQAGGR